MNLHGRGPRALEVLVGFGDSVVEVFHLRRPGEAIRDARRPSVWPVASTTYHWRSISLSRSE